MITEQDIDRALDYLRTSSTEAAQARANRLHLDDYSRVLKAQIMSEHLAEPVNAQERHAYSDVRYRNHLGALKQAIFLDEQFRFLRAAAEARIEAWRTMCSNLRAEGKAY